MDFKDLMDFKDFEKVEDFDDYHGSNIPNFNDLSDFFAMSRNPDFYRKTSLSH